MRPGYYIEMEIEGTAETHKIVFDYIPRKGDVLVIDFYGDEIIRYRVKEVIADITLMRGASLGPYIVPTMTNYRVIVEDMSG